MLIDGAEHGKTMKEMNINDIAKRLGIAKSTVSKALNNRSDVGEKTKKRVMQLVGELNYAPNHYAQALKFRKSRLVGIITHDDLHEEFFSQLVKGITAELRKHGYATIFASSEKTGEREKTAIREQMGRSVDGFILIPCAEPDVSFINGIIRQGYKFVMVDNCVEGINAPFVGSDFAKGAYLATKYLLDSGHRQIGYLGGPKWAASTEERTNGYKRAYHDAGIKLPETLMANCEYEDEDSKESFMKLRKDNPRMTAIHCSGLNMTKGALAGMSELGLDVPKDISIIDFGSTSFISSVDQKAGEIGRTAVRTLLDLFNGRDVPSKSIVAPELVIRNSTRSLRERP